MILNWSVTVVALSLVLVGIAGLRHDGRVRLGRRSIGAPWPLWVGSFMALRGVALIVPAGWQRDGARSASFLIFISPMVWDLLNWIRSKVRRRRRKRESPSPSASQ